MLSISNVKYRFYNSKYVWARNGSHIFIHISTEERHRAIARNSTQIFNYVQTEKKWNRFIESHDQTVVGRTRTVQDDNARTLQ